LAYRGSISDEGTAEGDAESVREDENFDGIDRKI
jgi:hypothetical protein